ncbi:MAG: H-NS histone family protein [Gammaproteobacteria bacterium]|nr:MAG: H-NS histone family protein [Gammaproteobacteria bacterium]RLA18084.1 MAG: H-NS histone family protein [Gammaproteobacteria bacterium]
MNTDLAHMSIEDLQQLISNAEDTIKKIQREKRSEVVRQMRQLATTIGVSIDIVPESRATSKRTGAQRPKTPPKFHNPADPSQTWTGRGPKPKWFKDAIASGKNPDALLIR